jgi:hypothetical protein
MKGRNVLIVTGMDRSGTSWVASALRASGVFMGERLFRAARGNPFGHFEDEDFLNLHIDLLTKANYEGLHKYGFPDLPPPTEIHVSEEHVQRALKLIESRDEYGLWGFKDPRTTLFLDFWQRLIPDMKVICLYRHPLEICISLFSRGDGFADLGGVFRAFQHRMGKALAFKQDSPEQMLLCNIHQVIAAPDQLEQMVYRHLKVPIEGLAANLWQSFAPQAFSSFSASTGTLIKFYQLFPETADLFERLEEAADMPLSAESKIMSLSAAREASQKVPFPTLDDHQNNFENLQLEFFSSLVEDGLAVEDVRKKIIVGLLENIKVMGGVHEEHIMLYEERDRLMKQLTAERAAFQQQIAMYEYRLHSQYLMTRHFVSLTLNNIKLVLRHPKLLLLKLRDWYRNRIRRQ